MKSIKDTLLIVKNVISRFSAETGITTTAALIGGHAAIFFGSERTTLDVDICLHAVGDRSGSSFVHALQKQLSTRYTIRFLEATKDPSDPLKHDIIIINDTENEYPRVDILLARYHWEVEGLEQAQYVEGLSFAVMPAPHLIAMKLLAGGRQDELDILNLLKELSDPDRIKTMELAKRVGRDRKLHALIEESAGN